jgi:hypothetical protein
MIILINCTLVLSHYIILQLIIITINKNKRKMSTWFSKIFGFNENADPEANFKLVKDMVSIHDISFDEDMKINILTLKNGQELWAGKFTMISIPELRPAYAMSAIETGSRLLTYVSMDGDVKLFHEDPKLEGSVFQVASQFNTLEMVNPSITPNMGITIYKDDRTQGPVCAMACPAGTLFRNYFVNVHGQDTPKHQLDGLKDAHALLEGYASGGPLWKMQNGYCFPTNAETLLTVCRLLQPDTPLRRQFMDSIRYGVQWNTQVIPSSKEYNILSDCHKVTQVYCSALPIAYLSHWLKLVEWTNFATAVLDAAYEATLAAGVILCDQRKGARVKVFLTSVGGGAFGNDSTWITESIKKACAKFAKYPLDVILINYKKDKQYNAATLDAAAAAAVYSPPAAYPPDGAVYSPPAAAYTPPPPPPAATAAVYSPAAAAAAAVDQTKDIRLQHVNVIRIGSSQWIPAPTPAQHLWNSYLTDPYGNKTQHTNTNKDKVMITNTKKVILRHWNPVNTPETGIGIMDVNDIKVYLIGPSLPPDNPNMQPGWYPARDYQIFAYLDFMYNTDQPQQSEGVTYFASQESSNDLQGLANRYRLIKNFDGVVFNISYEGDPIIIFTMKRLPNGSICYQKNDAGRTQVMISGIPIEREAYTLEIAASSSIALANARQMWRNRPQPQPPQSQPAAGPALPGSPLQPMVAAPMRPIHIPRTSYLAPAPAGSPPFPPRLMSDVEAGDDDRECVICWTNKPNLRFNCNHCVCCIKCYIANSNRLVCPICRARVTSLALCDEGGAEFQPQGCLGPFCKWFKTIKTNFSRRNRVAPRPGGNGGKNKNRKLQKLQKQRATRKNQNKKQSRRRGQRQQPRHIRDRGSRRSS